jgi:calcineurin-like phosphoesterase family protein
VVTQGLGLSHVVRDLMNGHFAAALASVNDTVLLGGALVVAVLVALGARRWRSSPTALAAVIGLTVGALVLGGTWQARAIVRDVKEDRGEAVANVLLNGDTAAPDGPTDSADLWAVGDSADGRPGSRAVVDMMAANDPDLILNLGDVYGPYAARMDAVYGALADRVRATPGNHDWHRPPRIREYLNFWETQQQGRSLFYEFDVAGWNVLSLNSEIPQERTSAQLSWLRKQVSSPGDCRIAFFHRPRFSAGRHGDQGDMDHLWDTMLGHVTLVLNGHDHDMQRLKPIGGVTEMVVGSGGHGHYTLHDDPRVAFGDDTHDGALHLQLRPGVADYAFTAADGTVLDSGRLTCSAD